jgi:hypothetical protein
LGGTAISRAIVAVIWRAIIGRRVIGPIAIPVVPIVAGRLPQARIGVVDAAAKKQGASKYQDTAHARDVARPYLVLQKEIVTARHWDRRDNLIGRGLTCSIKTAGDPAGQNTIRMLMSTS